MFQRFAILCALLLLSCSDNNDNFPVQVDHIKYFGFTLVDTFWDDPADSVNKTNYSDEVASFSNVADILVIAPSDDIVPRMELMSQLQMKGILHLSELFFELEGSNAPSGTDYKLRLDYQTRWDIFAAVNDLATNQNLLQAFYIGEEPKWNGISFTELQMAANYVKVSFPNIPIMVIEASPALNGLQIPASVDWVGFDHYFIKDPKNNPTFVSELHLLKSKLSTEQKLVLVMDTHYIESLHKDFGDIALDEMKNVAKSYYDLAKAESKTIAILGYFWPNGFDDANAVGARNMPIAVKQEYIRVGKEITGKQ